MEAHSALPNSPAVSVILATYNWPSVLQLAIRSVLNQTFRDFELLVVGDCCTDETEEVVAAFGDPRIRWHNLPRNSGNQAGPNNAGLEMARAPLTAYMHQDDLWFPDHLQLLTQGMAETPHNLAHTLSFVIAPPPGSERDLIGLPSPYAPWGPQHEKRQIWACSMMHRTQPARDLGGWRHWKEIRRTPVQDFIQRLIGPHQRFHSVTAATVLKFHSANRRNSYIDKPCQEQKEFLARMEHNPDLLRSQELLSAIECRAAGRYEKSLIAEPPPDAPPGWQIEQMNRARGLSEGELAPVDPRTLRSSLLKVPKAARRLVPKAIRHPAGRLLKFTGGWLERDEL